MPILCQHSEVKTAFSSNFVDNLTEDDRGTDVINQKIKYEASQFLIHTCKASVAPATARDPDGGQKSFCMSITNKAVFLGAETAGRTSTEDAAFADAACSLLAMLNTVKERNTQS